MRQVEFKAWLEAEGYKPNTVNTQLAQSRRMDSAYGDLDALYRDGGFERLRHKLGYSKQDERNNRANPAAFEIAGNLYDNLASYRASLTYYERFLTSAAMPALNRDALERLKLRFLAAYPDFEAAGGFTGRSRFHDAVDDYKRSEIAAVAEALAPPPQSDVDLGRDVLDRLDNRWLVSFITVSRLKAIRARHPQRFEMATAHLLRSTSAPGEAAAAYLAEVWPLLLEGSENNQPYSEARILPSVVLALARPDSAIAVAYERYHNLGIALLGRPLFGNNVLTAKEYEDILALARAIFTIMDSDWGWHPRDLWDVQGFVWETCKTKLGSETVPAGSSEASLIEPVQLDLTGPYWFVGASYGRTDDQLDRFIAEGIWQIDDPSDRHREQVLRMQPGQRIAIKATYTRRNGLPFANNGATVSVMSIKATGTITENPQDGARVRVAWKPIGELREWYGYTYQPTIWEVYPTKEMAQRLIAFAFDGQDQDYAWFMRNMTSWATFGVTEASAELEAADPIPRDPVNLILYGPPGTGKTFATVAQSVRLCNGLPETDTMLTDPVRRDELRARYVELGELGRIAFVTFHQNYSYEDFVEGLRPTALAGGGFTLSPEPGVLRRMVTRALESPEEHVLIIDEINRANISKVFGELITLIERDKRIGMSEEARLTLAFSPERFGVPANLHIVGTMNTADRSIALLDTALRRRFEFRELMPDPALLSPVDGIDLTKLLTTLNERIEYLFDREHQIGHAFLIGCKTKGDVDAVMRHRIIPLLAEYFYEDWGKVAAVLGDAGGKRRFLERVELKSPLGADADGDAAPRYRWTVKAEEFDYAGLAA